DRVRSRFLDLKLYWSVGLTLPIRRRSVRVSGRAVNGLATVEASTSTYDLRVAPLTGRSGTLTSRYPTLPANGRIERTTSSLTANPVASPNRTSIPEARTKVSSSVVRTV